MEYIWIVILIIAYIIWAVVSIKDFIETIDYFKFPYALRQLEGYTAAFIILHIIALFGFSLYKFIVLKNQ